MRDTMNPDRPEARVAGEDFEFGSRSWIALQHGGDVFADAFEQGHKSESGFRPRSQKRDLGHRAREFCGFTGIPTPGPSAAPRDDKQIATAGYSVTGWVGKASASWRSESNSTLDR